VPDVRVEDLDLVGGCARAQAMTPSDSLVSRIFQHRGRGRNARAMCSTHPARGQPGYRLPFGEHNCGTSAWSDLASDAPPFPAGQRARMVRGVTGITFAPRLA